MKQKNIINDSRLIELKDLERKVDVEFSNINLLNQALTHSSYANEFKGKKIKDNENLEFLGDAVLGLVVSEYIYLKFPKHKEGDLSKLRSVIVSRSLLAKFGKELNLGKYIMLGKGEKVTGGHLRESILANTVEALIGAIYLDKNLSAVQDFILQKMKNKIDLASEKKYKTDYKSILQEYTQSKYKQKPIYEVIQEKGPDHIKEFKIQVLVNEKIKGIGEGRSKKEAEQQAAYRALLKFDAIDE